MPHDPDATHYGHIRKALQRALAAGQEKQAVDQRGQQCFRRCPTGSLAARIACRGYIQSACPATAVTSQEIRHSVARSRRWCSAQTNRQHSVSPAQSRLDRGKSTDAKPNEFHRTLLDLMSDHRSLSSFGHCLKHLERNESARIDCVSGIQDGKPGFAAGKPQRESSFIIELNSPMRPRTFAASYPNFEQNNRPQADKRSRELNLARLCDILNSTPHREAIVAKANLIRAMRQRESVHRALRVPHPASNRHTSKHTVVVKLPSVDSPSSCDETKDGNEEIERSGVRICMRSGRKSASNSLLSDVESFNKVPVKTPAVLRSQNRLPLFVTTNNC